MIEKVVKRDGRVVKFNKRKIRDAVENAFESAGVTPEEYGAIPSIIAKTIEDSKKDAVTVNVDDIHKAVEKQLAKHGFKNVRKAYKSCRNDRDVARKAPSRKAFKEIIEAKPSDVTRENANMNADTPAGMMMKFASETTKSYVKDVLLSDDVKEAIENNYIHCHDLDYYPSKSLTCLQHPLDKLFENGFVAGHGESRSPKRIETASIQACISMETIQNEMHTSNCAA